MMFNSEIFLFLFLPIVLVVYYLLPNKLRNYWLLIVSILFYAYNNISYTGILIFNIFLNYFGGLIIAQQDDKSIKKLFLVFTIILNVFLLFHFKYFNFITDIIISFTNNNLSIPVIIVPVGISFYTFQGLSYVIDVYRKDIKVQNNILKYALYLSFFPQLVAGPVVRYKDVCNDIDDRSVNVDDIVLGIKRFIIGLAKKVILADGMAVIVDAIWGLENANLTSSIAWLGAISYTFQIYFDFSGYSDIAIGLGRMLGFHIPENFNLPYLARSIKGFWRRWHISLSTWFKDYVYIPLGGNRKNHLLNVFLVFLLTGIWHGAGFQFIIWGLWHACFNILERLLKRMFPKWKGNKITSFLGHWYTLLVVIIGWVYFRSGSILEARTHLTAMFTNSVASSPGYSVTWFLTKYNILLLILCILCCTSLPQKIYQKVSNRVHPLLYKVLEYTCLLLVFVITLMTIVTSHYNSFIYFQF